MNSTATTPTATPIVHLVTSIQDRFTAMIAKSNAKIELMKQQDVFLFPLSLHALITGGKEEYKQMNELRKKFSQALKKKQPIEPVCDEIYALAQEHLEVITASPRVSKKYTADDLAAFRQAIDAYSAMK
ncbi:MAG: hypothetical protein SH857_06870 [Chitinophagales bacterium]|nr:hypothetical protein [Chitinophagales bacterium]